MASRKPATKKAAKKPAKRTPSTNKPATAQKSAAIANAVNEAMGFNAIGTVEDSGHTSLLRRPCGIAGLDVDTGGGLPADAVTLIVGPDGAGKTVLLDYYYAFHQMIYGDDARILHIWVETKPDYLLMRKVGCRVGLPLATIDDMEEGRRQLGMEPLTLEERTLLMEKTGTFHIATGGSGEEVLTILLKALETGFYHIIGIDSLSVLTSEAEYEKDMDDKEKMAARALLKRKFFDRYHKLQRKLPALGGLKHETTILATGQVRADMEASTYGRKFKNQDGWAVKHGNSVTVIVENGEKIKSGRTADKGAQVGKWFKWETQKGKEGVREGRKGKVQFMFNDNTMKSMIDINASLIEPLIKNGLLIERRSGIDVLDANGSNLLEGINGVAELIRLLDEDPQLSVHVRQVLANKVTGLPCLFRRG
jgi:RecA/RadA recombinase